MDLTKIVEKIIREYEPIKILGRNKKSGRVTITVTEEQLSHLEARIEKWHKEKEYEKWFRENHERRTWEDEYGSIHDYWVEKKTGKEVQRGKIPYWC